MNFKKLLALLLALAMLLCCFAACDSSDKDDDDEDEKVEDEEKDEDEDNEDEDDEDDDDKSSKGDEDDENEDDDDDKVVNTPSTPTGEIAGKWVLRMPFVDIMEMSGLAAGSGIDLDKLDCKEEVYISLEFDDDTVYVSIDMGESVEEFCDAYMDYVKNGGIYDMLDAAGVTYEQYEQMLDQNGMTWDDFYDTLESDMDKAMQEVDLTAVESEDYTFDGEVVEFGDSSMTVEIDGDEMEIIEVDGEDSENVAMLFEGQIFEKVA